MNVTFFGHRDAPSSVQPLLKEVLQNLIINHGANVFYVGHQGQFDSMVRQTLRLLEAEYPHIRWNIVLAYMPEKQNEFDCTKSIPYFPKGLKTHRVVMPYPNATVG